MGEYYYRRSSGEDRPFDDFLDKLWRERLLGLIMTGHFLENFRLPAPLTQGINKSSCIEEMKDE